MADVKLVIKINEDVYTRLFDNGIQDNEIAIDDICEMARSIRRGIPFTGILDKIMDEIKQYQSHLQEGCIVWNELEKCLRIIDKYGGVNE